MRLFPWASQNPPLAIKQEALELVKAVPGLGAIASGVLEAAGVFVGLAGKPIETVIAVGDTTGMHAANSV